MIPMGTPEINLMRSSIVTPGAKISPKIFRRFKTDSDFCSDFLSEAGSGFCFGMCGMKTRTRMTLIKEPMAANSDANCSLE